MSRVAVRVRASAPGDACRLVRLARGAEVPVGAGGARQLRGELDSVLEERVAALLNRPDRTVLVAEDPEGDTDADLIGMVVLADDEVGALLPISVLRASHLLVAPSHRRRGVGRALLAGATEVAEHRGHDHLVTSSMQNSREVNRYFARLGFVPLVSRRIAPTAVLRRSLGIGASRQAVAQRRASIVRSGRRAPATRLLSRGA